MIQTAISNTLVLFVSVLIAFPFVEYISVRPTFEIEESPNDLTVMKGSTLTLNCKAKGFPTPRVSILLISSIG